MKDLGSLTEPGVETLFTVSALTAMDVSQVLLSASSASVSLPLCSFSALQTLLPCIPHRGSNPFLRAITKTYHATTCYYPSFNTELKTKYTPWRGMRLCPVKKEEGEYEALLSRSSGEEDEVVPGGGDT